MTSENKLLERLTKQSCCFLVLFFLSSIFITKIYGQIIFFEQEKTKGQDTFEKKNTLEGYEKEAWEQDKQHSTKEIKKKLGKNYIKIKKNQTNLLAVDYTEHNVARELVLDIYNMNSTSISMEDIVIIWNGKKQKNVENSRNKIIKDLSIRYSTTDKGTFGAHITMKWKHVYMYSIYEDRDYIYVDYKRPKEVYDHIVVVDAGHGGADTGTYAKRGKWAEKDYNLDFVNKIREIWQDENVKLCFTRLNDEEVSLSDRVEFANDLEADLFVSIHCNSTDEYAGNGLEALYKSKKYGEISKSIAENCLANLEESTGLSNRGVLNGENIYIIRKAKMPTVLLEMGFLSDEKDLAYMEQQENRKKMADAVCVSIKQGLEQIK